MNSIVHFEIPVDNPKRAMRFYKSLFGWKFQKMGVQDYWVIYTGKKGINGGIAPRIGLFKKKGSIGSYVCTIEVADLEKLRDKVKKVGGKWADEGGLIHGVGFQQYFKDTEGNLFGCLQPDTKAKTV